MPRVLVVGSINTDLSLRIDQLPLPGQTVFGREFATLPGGKGANQAVAASRAGGDVAFIAAVGDDDYGRKAVANLRAEAVDVGHVRVLPGVSSGVALILTARDGENMIAVDSGANAELSQEHISSLPESLFQRGAALLVGLEIPLDTACAALERGRRAGMITILNPAPAPEERAAAVARLLPLVDCVTPNRLEARAIAGLAPHDDDAAQAAARILERGARGVVITLSSEGCLVAWPGEMRTIPPRPVPVVDCVGAGDAFSGAIAVALAEGKPLPEAAAWANQAAALAVTRYGAQSALPRRAEIEHAIAQNARQA